MSSLRKLIAKTFLFDLIVANRTTTHIDDHSALRDAAWHENTSSVVFLGDTSDHKQCELAAIMYTPATAWTWLDDHFPNDDQGNIWRLGCYVRVDDSFETKSEKHCSCGKVLNSSTPAPSHFPAPHPTPSPQPKPSPIPSPQTPSPFMPAVIAQKLPTPPTTFAAASGDTQVQVTTVNSNFYFLPTVGSKSATILKLSNATTPSDAVWNNISIDSSTGVMSFLNGAAFAGIASQNPAIQNDFLIISGGEWTHRVVSYNIQEKRWNTSIASMAQDTYDLCAIGCEGYAFMATGVLKKNIADSAESMFKPADRQIYRYNLTSGQMFENNMEKQRAGASCACLPSNNPLVNGRVFFAGGISDAGVSNNIEMWGADPLKRRGQPCFSMSHSKTNPGATVCGPYLVVIGGTDGKHVFPDVDIFNASSTTAQDPLVALQLSTALFRPQVTCLEDRYVLVAGGQTSVRGPPSSEIFVLDINRLPGAHSVIQPQAGVHINSTSVIGMAGNGRDAVIFDGTSAYVITISV